MSDTLHSAFRRLTASLGPQGSHEPHAYQLAIAEALLSGKRVVTRVPVTGGKSLAAWFPWLLSRQQSYDFPRQLVHILPGGSFVGNLQQRLQAFSRGVGDLHIAVQTTGDAFDPFFLADATITSADHLLSIALHRASGLHPVLSNIDAGMMHSACLFFDEFPALASRDMLVLWLGLLRQYYPVTPCLFGSGALPRPVMARIAEALDAVFVDAGTMAPGGRRRWTRGNPMSAEAIIRQHHGRTIVVCNTVRGAQTLYRALQRALAQVRQPIRLLLLHQYQFYRDRLPVEEEVGRFFGHGEGGNAILVTTSGVEIGPSCTADLLITDPAPPDALLRRAGRCARFPGEEGQVIVAPVTEQIPGECYPSPPPDLLVGLLADGTRKSPADELAAFDAIWEAAPADHQPEILRRLPTDAEIDLAPREVMGGREQFPRRLFSRVGACLHRMPETVRDPFELERFSLATSSLERGWRQWQASGCQGEWFALIPHWPAFGQQVPNWSPIERPEEFRADARLIVLNAEAVSYDPVIGLELAPGTSYQSERLALQHTDWSPFDQHTQHFAEHAQRTRDAFVQLSADFRYALRHAGMRWRIPLVELERWMQLCMLWHDAGKLTADWQLAAFRWQEEVARRPFHNQVVGRVDYQYGRDGKFPCPEHAVATGRALSRAFSVLLGAASPLYQGTDRRLDPSSRGHPLLRRRFDAPSGRLEYPDRVSRPGIS